MALADYNRLAGSGQNALRLRKIKKKGQLFWYNVKNNYLCVFIWRKALKLKEIT
jgi:hypothetical protein